MASDMAFGALVATIRREKNLKQEELARRVSRVHKKPVGGSTISRIEQGDVPVSLGLGLSIIEALNPAPGLRRRLEEALDDYSNAFVLPLPYRSGAVLDRVMKNLGMTNKQLAEMIGKTHQLIQALRGGSKLASDEVLVAMRRELLNRGADPDQLKELTRLHVVDVIMTMPRLNYLSSDQKRKLADCAAKVV